MRRMSRLLLIVAVVACGKSSAPTPSGRGSGSGSGSGSAVAAGPADPFAQAIAGLDGLRARMCKCQDTACTGEVMEAYRQWRVSMKRATTGKRPTPAQDRRANGLDHELRTCRSAIEAKVVAAAGNGPGAAGSGDGARELDAFRARMCACHDKPCADRVQADLATWQRARRARTDGAPPPIEDARDRAIERELAACRARAEAATPGAPGAEKIDAMIAKLATFRDRMCACKDRGCATAVAGDLERWQQARAAEMADVKPTPAQGAKLDALAAALDACKQRLRP